MWSPEGEGGGSEGEGGGSEGEGGGSEGEGGGSEGEGGRSDRQEGVKLLCVYVNSKHWHSFWPCNADDLGCTQHCRLFDY